jgi:predicted nucleic acid-binding protein
VTGVEVIAGITRRSRGGSLSPADATAALAQFRAELANLFRLVEITPSLLNRAMMLAERHAIRGYDAVQLSAALHLNARRTARGQSPLAFVSADVELNAAAGAEGLLPDDPNNHP